MEEKGSTVQKLTENFKKRILKQAYFKNKVGKKITKKQRAGGANRKQVATS